MRRGIEHEKLDGEERHWREVWEACHKAIGALSEADGWVNHAWALLLRNKRANENKPPKE